jgi:hypothetical protein
VSWTQKLELIGSEHADAVRDIRLRIERIDSDAKQNNSDLGAVESAPKHSEAHE